MDKRGARILLGCLAGTVIVILLMLLATHLTHPTCELIIIEQSQFKSSALANFHKEKPIKSHDKSTLIKISAYLEYNIQKASDGKSSSHATAATTSQPDGHTSAQTNQDTLLQPAAQHHPATQSVANPPPAGQNSQQQPQVPNQVVAQVPAQASTGQQQQQQQQQPAQSKGPIPSTPQSAFTNQQLANSSFPLVANQTTSGTGSGSESEKPRFLPLELEEIEMRKNDDNKYIYTLNFNCSTMKLYFVRKAERVYVERISLELDLKSQKKSTCELKLPTSEILGAEVSPQNGWARYYCDKPLKYSCYHHSSKHPEILLAELHINAIEYETPGASGQQPQHQSGSNSSSSSSGSSSNKLIHKKHEFSGTRHSCSV